MGDSEVQSFALRLLLGLLLTALLAFGPGRPLAARLALDAAESLVATVVLSLLVVWCAGWALFVCHAPPRADWILPALAVAGLAWDRRGVAALVRDPGARGLAAGQILVTGWCLGLLAFVPSYSAGTWSGDWFEHWERALFFRYHWPLDHLFLGIYPLPVRPPLVNVFSADLLGMTGTAFDRYQVGLCVLSSLAYLPAGLLAKRFGGPRAPAILAVLMMANPLFVANTAFAWTKLPAAFFALAGLAFFLRFRDGGRVEYSAAFVCAAALSAGMLAHYSVGPYAVVLAVAWLALGRRRWREASYRGATLLAAVTAIAVAATWFAWSFAVYGFHTTALSNTSVTGAEEWRGSQIAKIALNLRDTLVPHALRRLDRSLIDQTSPWGLARDWIFECYQLNFPFALGCVAWLAAARESVRAAREAAPANRAFWIAIVAWIAVLGVAVHGSRDTWGLAHICLQALVLLGLAFLAGRWDRLGAGWKRAVIAGSAVDLTLGVAFHFAVQDYAFDRWLTPGRPFGAVASSYSLPSRMNLAAKLGHRLIFFGEILSPLAPLMLALLAAFLILALARARRPAAQAGRGASASPLSDPAPMQ